MLKVQNHLIMLQRFRSLNLVELSLEHCDVKKIIIKGEQKRKERMKLMSRLTTRKRKRQKMVESCTIMLSLSIKLADLLTQKSFFSVGHIGRTNQIILVYYF